MSIFCYQFWNGRKAEQKIEDNGMLWWIVGMVKSWVLWIKCLLAQLQDNYSTLMLSHRLLHTDVAHIAIAVPVGDNVQMYIWDPGPQICDSSMEGWCGWTMIQTQIER